MGSSISLTKTNTMNKIIALLLAASTLQLTAQTNVWLGNSPGWLNNANWSLGTFPTSSCASDIEIPALPVGGFFPIIGPSLSPFIGNLTIGDGATLSVGNLGINVCGDIICGSTTTSSFIGNGEVRLVGTALQTISGKARFKKIKNQNTSTGVEVTGNVEVVERWVCEDGDLTNNGSITLLSDVAGTAYLDLFTYPGAAGYNGNITAQQYIDNAAAGYRDVSFPVSTTVADVADDFTVAGQHGVNCWYAYSPYPTFQEYREHENADTDNYYGGFWSITQPAAAIGGAKGYAARIYNAPLTLDVTGTPATGTTTIGLSHTPSSTPSADGWNLVGNPFCAPIKWSTVLAQNPGITSGSCYRFSTTGEYAGTWNAHNGVTGVPISTPDEISMSQGFFVHAPTSATLVFNPSACVASNTVLFYKTDMLNNEVRIKLSSGTQADEIVAYTDATATAGYDAGKDAVKMPADAAVQLGFETTTQPFAINVLQDITAATELPLQVSVSTDGVYQFSVVALNVPGLQVLLRDATTGTLYSLEATDASFTLLAGQNYNQRFSLVFQEGVSAVAAVAEQPVHIYAMGKELHIQRASAGHADVTVSNLMGQQITGASVQAASAAIELPCGFTGYAVVQVQHAGGISTQKVLIK